MWLRSRDKIINVELAESIQRVGRRIRIFMPEDREGRYECCYRSESEAKAALEQIHKWLHRKGDARFGEAFANYVLELRSEGLN